MAVPPVAGDQPEEHTDQENNQEYPEQENGKTRDGRGNAAESKNGGDDGENQ